MSPKRRDEVIDGGSIYWVIKGAIRCRQRVIDLEEFTNEAGIKHCAIVLDDNLIETAAYPHRAFQGWRYLAADKTPPDAKTGGNSDALPEDMAMELRDLGLI
jgi:hypothetical protein